MSTCPFDAVERSSLNQMESPNQEPHPSQSQPLSKDRSVSSIPMGGKHAGHQWIYPSEQMFYNAMKRKQWDPQERDMSVVVPIHNAVNEQAWKEILIWESLHDSYVKREIDD